eukprot:scaffold4159_cov69-Cylindrotheca_fusiformis.AAC.1
MNFVTVTVPTTLQAANQHTVLENRRHPQPLPRQELPWQHHHHQKEEVEGIRSEAVIVLPVEHTTATSVQVTTTASTATATPALRKQDGPKLRISVRRRVTDALNSPFNYEMTEAARVVL